MGIVAIILILLVAIEHVYILYIEMFAWESLGAKIFKGSLSPDLFKPTKGLAANQGLYNGFLAAGLIWSLIVEEERWQVNIALFFLVCILIAAIYGGLSANKKIFLTQGLPALLAFLSLLLKW